MEIFSINPPCNCNPYRMDNQKWTVGKGGHALFNVGPSNSKTLKAFVRKFTLKNIHFLSMNS